MFQILHPQDQKKGKIASVEFEGEPYGAGVSFFVGKIEPGKGPGLHQHPYAETCIVLSGQAAIVIDGEELLASAGDIVVIGPATPHSFIATGNERLDMVAIHHTARFIIESLEN
ncbi:MAG: cupin domain-containing protein [Acidobacteria bacterium]|nr:MAG: cupin domain-containing protein [Acidobacteriota bacterium]